MLNYQRVRTSRKLQKWWSWSTGETHCFSALILRALTMSTVSRSPSIFGDSLKFLPSHRSCKAGRPLFSSHACITCYTKFWNSLDRYVFRNTMAFPTYDRYITYRYHMIPHPHTSCLVLSLFPLSLSLVLVEPRGLSLPHIFFQFLNLVASSHWDLQIGKHINNTTSVWMKTYQHDKFDPLVWSRNELYVDNNPWQAEAPHSMSLHFVLSPTARTLGCSR